LLIIKAQPNFLHIKVIEMKSFDDLKPAEKDLLLKFPVYVSMLAAEKDDHLDKIEKRTAIQFCHIKTFTCDPLLSQFYHEAEKNFETNITELDSTLPVNKSEREEIIINELAKIENILLNLGTDYALVMHRSMRSFKNHVSRAHRNILEYFVFPLPISGITD
jgi:tellurite resistance protein